MSVRLVNAASEALARRTGRRGFLARTAVVGTAATVAPRRFLLEPISAYAAVCNCSGSTCDCAASCCDGYTEFCCTITGSNSCPPGTLAAGWWKADAPGLCGSAPRYYIDCNVAPGQSPCRCGCANGSCGHRKACCTQFRYGQCHQEVPVVGAIMCRVVTCTPPWVIDPTCTTAIRTDNATRNHNAACLAVPPPPTGGLKEGGWYLRNQPNGGVHDLQISYGSPTDLPIVGDWNGDGTMTPGVFRKGIWYLRNAPGSGAADVSFAYGNPNDLPIVGRWVPGDPRHYPGVIRGTTWYLRTSHTSGAADIVISYGDPGDVAVVGDWNGDGQDGIGIFRAGGWYLRNTLSSGVAELTLSYGGPGDVPMTGRWVQGDPHHYPGIVRRDAWYLRHSLTSGVADSSFGYGTPGDIPLVGDWDGNGRDGVGVAR